MERFGLRLGAIRRRLPYAKVWLLAGPLCGVTAYLLGALVLTPITEHFLPQATSGQCESVRDSFGALPLIGLPIICLAAPFVEESLFRGVVFGGLLPRVGTAGAVIISGLVFGLFHFIALLFVALAVFGMMLALLARYSGSLWPGIAAHATFNAIGFYFIFFGSAGCV